MSQKRWTKLNKPERVRTYLYPDGTEVKFEDVTDIAVSESNTHYLNTADGMKYIVAPGWLCIALDMDDWTF